MLIRKLSTIIFFPLIIAGSVLAQDYTSQSLNDKYRPLTDDSQIMQLCREYMSKASDMDVIRDAQDKYKSIDPDSVLAFSKLLYDAHPDSAKYAYLYGRMVEGAAEKIAIGRKVVSLSPQWPYGYRLIVATYVDALLGASEKNAAEAELKKSLPGDQHYIKELVKLEPTQIYPLQFLLAYYLYNKNYDSALTTLQNAETLKKGWPSQSDFASLYMAMGRYPEAQKALKEYVDLGVTKGQWSAEEAIGYADRLYSDGLRGVHAYDEALNYRLNNGTPLDSTAAYDVACLYALTGNKEKAFEYLSKAGDLKWSNAAHVKEDSDLVSLRNDPRWQKILDVYQANYDSGTGKRKAAALASKVDHEAPLWTLNDEKGNSVSLADLRGKIVIIDFWATWCVYCKMAMPLLNQFTAEKSGNDNIRVFAIDVMEKGQGKVLKFYQEKAYKMKMLYGNDDVAKAYGVRGIPYICVIDKNGRIRYIEYGYSPDLKEKLAWYAEDLLTP